MPSTSSWPMLRETSALVGDPNTNIPKIRFPSHVKRFSLSEQQYLLCLTLSKFNFSSFRNPPPKLILSPLSPLPPGTLYAAKFTQRESNLTGGEFDVEWIELGSGSDAEVASMVGWCK